MSEEEHSLERIYHDFEIAVLALMLVGFVGAVIYIIVNYFTTVAVIIAWIIAIAFVFAFLSLLGRAIRVQTGWDP